jgi:cellobiose-specific phosphotransferase system component IIB
LESFFGIIANSANITLNITSQKGKQIVQGKSDFLMLGGQYACGVMKIECTKNNNDVYISKINNIDFTMEALKKELNNKGFERIKMEYQDAIEELWLTFYTE